MSFEKTRDTSDDEDDKNYAVESNSRTSLSRRQALLLGTGGFIALTGSLFLLDGTGEELPIPEVKERAYTVPYNDLLRNPDAYEGDYLRFDSGEIWDVIEYSERVELRVFVSEEQGEWSDTIRVSWGGRERFMLGDIVRVWGEFNGLHSYETGLGQERNAPEIDARHIERLDGDYSG